MRRGGYVAAVVACAAVAAGALTGCEGDGGDPTPSPSQSASSSAPPPSPSESTSASPQGETAEEFIRRWVEVGNAMQDSGDTAEYRELSRGCTACIATADQIDEIYRSGGRVETDGWTVISLDRQGSAGRSVTFRVLIDNAVTEYTERAGGPTKTLPAGRPTMQITVTKRQGNLTVSDLSQVAT